MLLVDFDVVEPIAEVDHEEVVAPLEQSRELLEARVLELGGAKISVEQAHVNNEAHLTILLQHDTDQRKEHLLMWEKLTEGLLT